MTTGLNSTGKSSVGGNGAVNLTRYAIIDNYGTAIYNGDPVSIDASTGGIIICPETAKPIGVMRGIMYISPLTKGLEFLNYYPANTISAGSIDGDPNVIALIEDVAGKEFYIQVSDANVTVADIGDNKRLKSTGTQIGATGRSGAVVDMDATITSELRLVKILGLQQTPNNAYGTSTADVRVVIV